jgi:hypothetical protein
MTGTCRMIAVFLVRYTAPYGNSFLAVAAPYSVGAPQARGVRGGEAPRI